MEPDLPLQQWLRFLKGMRWCTGELCRYVLGPGQEQGLARNASHWLQPHPAAPCIGHMHQGLQWPPLSCLRTVVWPSWMIGKCRCSSVCQQPGRLNLWQCIKKAISFSFIWLFTKSAGNNIIVRSSSQFLSHPS